MSRAPDSRHISTCKCDDLLVRLHAAVRRRATDPGAFTCHVIDMNRTPIETAKHIFSAFGRGDVPAILASLSPDVQREYGPVSQNVPWYQNRHGIEGAADFFQSLAGCEFHRFNTTAFTAERDTVVVFVDSDYIRDA